MKKIFLILFLIIPFCGMSQVDIVFHIDDQQDSVWYFCKYRGSKTAIVDTLHCIQGTARYLSPNELPQGIYLLMNENRIPMTEVLVGKQQAFSVSISDLNDLNSAKVLRAKETDRFFKMMAKVRMNEMQIAALESEPYSQSNAQKIDSLKKDITSFGEKLKIKKKGSFINLFINSLKRHNMEEYWDDFQLDDPRILTYPLIDNKLEAYFNSLPVNADIINAEIDKLTAKTGDCTEVRDYLIWYFYRKYYSPEYMNLDDVYIHLVDEYFLKYEMENVSESIMNMMADRAYYLEHLKIGAKLPEIAKLYSVKSEYIAVVFYDKTCKKCAQEGRILEEIHSRHPEMTIFPVEVNSGIMDNLLVVYDIQTTPTIYLLDRNKIIIAKRIKAEQVERFLNID